MLEELVVEQEVTEEPEDIKTVLAALKEIQTAAAAQPEPEPVAAPAPTPAPPPPAPTGRVTQEQYSELARYAAEQRKRAEQVELAVEFDLSPDALVGDFESPADMRRHAEVLALRKQMATLETALQEAQVAATEPPAVPLVDTGGPTSTEDSRVTELKHKYEEARAGGRTEKARKALLTAIYSDPSKILTKS